jgi:hypothetical protein
MMGSLQMCSQQTSSYKKLITFSTKPTAYVTNTFQCSQGVLNVGTPLIAVPHPPVPFPLRGGQAVLFIPLSRIETEKMGAAGRSAAGPILSKRRKMPHQHI